MTQLDGRVYSLATMFKGQDNCDGWQKKALWEHLRQRFKAGSDNYMEFRRVVRLYRGICHVYGAALGECEDDWGFDNFTELFGPDLYDPALETADPLCTITLLHEAGDITGEEQSKTLPQIIAEKGPEWAEERRNAYTAIDEALREIEATGNAETFVFPNHLTDKYTGPGTDGSDIGDLEARAESLMHETNDQRSNRQYRQTFDALSGTVDRMESESDVWEWDENNLEPTWVNARKWKVRKKEWEDHPHEFDTTGRCNCLYHTYSPEGGPCKHELGREKEIARRAGTVRSDGERCSV